MGFAQKHDYTWILGTQFDNSRDSCLYGMEIKFGNPILIKRIPIYRTISGHSNAFSDTNGKLQYYTNGCAILTTGDQIIDSGDSLNLTYDFSAFCTGTGQPPGVPYPNSSLFLPLQNGKLLYLSLETWLIPNKYPYVFSPNILSTLVDTIQNRLIYKNINILEDRSTLSRIGLSACKHLDNNSWWVIARNQLDSAFRVILVKNDTIINKTQVIGNKYISGDIGQSSFSPDGKWFAWYSQSNGLELMQFDRNLGNLYNYKKIPILDTFTYGYGGVAFSPNSQFLYVNSQLDIFQFDLNSHNIENSVEHINHFKGSLCSCGLDFPTYYYQMQLGPDCRIYLSSTSSSHCLHLINYPDRKGQACNFLEAGFNLPSLNHRALPQFPNYRIDQAYPCDSTIRFATSNLDFGDEFLYSEVYPNPGSDVLNVNVVLGSIKEASFSLWDINGHRIIDKQLSNYQDHYSIDISGIPAGIYFYYIQSRGRILKNGRFIKIF